LRRLAPRNKHTHKIYPLDDSSSNYNTYTKNYIPSKKKSQEKLFTKFPLLKKFRPKYTKRENVDKKILRRFKYYLKDKLKCKSISLDIYDKRFWIMFINGNIFPPIKFKDNNTEEEVEFKSFNSKFIAWLFSKNGANELYNLFIKEDLINTIDNIIKDYNINSVKEIEELEYYIRNMPVIFNLNADESLIQNISHLTLYKLYKNNQAVGSGYSTIPTNEK
jgi:hypothetical protein